MLFSVVASSTNLATTWPIAPPVYAILKKMPQVLLPRFPERTALNPVGCCNAEFQEPRTQHAATEVSLGVLR